MNLKPEKPSNNRIKGAVQSVLPMCKSLFTIWFMIHYITAYMKLLFHAWIAPLIWVKVLRWTKSNKERLRKSRKCHMPISYRYVLVEACVYEKEGETHVLAKAKNNTARTRPNYSPIAVIGWRWSSTDSNVVAHLQMFSKGSLQISQIIVTYMSESSFIAIHSLTGIKIFFSGFSTWQIRNRISGLTSL